MKIIRFIFPNNHIALNLQKSNTQTMECINCPICLDELGTSYATLPICQHRFHNECITQWIQSSGKQSCPTCGFIYGIAKGIIDRFNKPKIRVYQNTCMYIKDLSLLMVK